MWSPFRINSPPPPEPEPAPKPLPPPPPPFREDSTCAKCGPNVLGVSTIHCANKDRMRRECRRCSFVWYEAPLDSIVTTIEVNP
jgi:hypothetical protein